jgi:hypothetical protein
MEHIYISESEMQLLHPEIFEDVIKFYPLSAESKNENFYNYQGIKDITSVINKNIVDETNYSLWESKVSDELDTLLGKKVIGATYGNVPSVSGYINLNKSENLQIETNLYFYISLLSKYYSVEIIEFDLEKYTREIPNYGILKVPGINHVVVSPLGIYEKIFKNIELYLRREYSGYRFLPAIYDFIHLKNLYVIQNDITDNAISNAFFSKVAREVETPVFGDINYGDLKS